jgi:flagellar basal body-associated protein FliL
MLWLKIILKPVSIIAIIFSITIVLVGIGIAAMSGTVETLPVETLPAETLPAETLPATPAQQMNVESEVAEEELVQQNKAFEDTSTPLQKYVALQQEKAAVKAEAEAELSELRSNLKVVIPEWCDLDYQYHHKYLNEKELKEKERKQKAEKNMSDIEKCYFRGSQPHNIPPRP